MCRPISIIMSADSVFTPTKETWEHSHTAIAKLHNLPDGQIGDKYARVEVIPPDENKFRDKATNLVLVPDQTWTVHLDEKREPAWWSDDKPAQEDRAIQAAKKWLASFPENLVPGAIVTAGYAGTATAGYAGTATAGVRGTATAGDAGTATAGERGTATAGYAGTATAGVRGTATAGERGTATAGYAGTATAGVRGTATAGDAGTATAGERGTATAGYAGTATAGVRGTATAGDAGTATAGYAGTATAGEKGIVSWKVWDRQAERYRLHVCYVGEGDIKPNTKYRFEDGKPVEVK